MIAGAVTTYSIEARAATCTLSADGRSLAIQMSNAETLSVATDANGAVTANNAACGNVLASALSRVDVYGTTRNESLTVSVPGTVAIALGAGSDSVIISAGSANDVITVNDLGVDRDGDGINEVTYTGVESYTVRGNDGNDTISAVGFTRAINLEGGVGEDRLFGGSGADRLIGGSGNDELEGNGGADRLQGDDGADVLSGSAGNDTMVGGIGVDAMNAGDGDDTFDEETATNGGDSMIGGAGVDTISYARRAAAVSVNLDNVANDGAVNESDNVNLDVENILGGSGADVLNGSSVANLISGNGGNDTIRGYSGVDVLNGNAGNDTIYGGGDDDLIYGQDGNDTIYAESGNDVIFGGNGRDIMNGDDGDDLFDDQAVLSGADVFNGGVGVDSVTYAGRTTALVLSIDGAANDGAANEGDNVGADVENVTSGAGNDTIVGSVAANRLVGGAGDDWIRGELGADVLVGGDGADMVEGGEGDDTLEGNAGNDVLEGGDGNDTIDGGAGTDVGNDPTASMVNCE